MDSNEYAYLWLPRDLPRDVVRVAAAILLRPDLVSWDFTPDDVPRVRPPFQPRWQQPGDVPGGQCWPGGPTLLARPDAWVLHIPLAAVAYAQGRGETARMEFAAEALGGALSYIADTGTPYMAADVVPGEYGDALRGIPCMTPSMRGPALLCRQR